MTKKGIGKPLYIIAILSILIGLSSCSIFKKDKLHASSFFNQNSCYQDNVYHYQKQDIPLPLPELSLSDKLKDRFNHSSLQAANAIGIIDLLEEYLEKEEAIRQNSTLENRIEFLELSQVIDQKINLASLEISAISAQIDCEDERISQIASMLRDNESKREKNLTIGAIVVGAAGAVVTGVMATIDNLNNPAEYLGIAVGLTEATFGIMALNNEHTLTLKHPVNILKEIWDGKETSTIFPPSIWYYLNNYTSTNQASSLSLREGLIENWKDVEQLDNRSKRKKQNLITLYFGDGGTYNADQLENRANMYDQLESIIKLMKQNLKSLLSQVQSPEGDSIRTPAA